MRIFSRGFFVEHFLEEVIRLTHDNVSNVRLVSHFFLDATHF